MSNARKLSKLIVGTELKASNVDSDLANKIITIKGRLDSDDSKIQSLGSSIASVSSTAGLLDSDLKVVADLRSQLDSEIIFVRNLSLSYTNYLYNASAGQTSFSGSDANTYTLAYTAGSIQVFLNGIKLEADDFTATDGTTIVLTEAAIANAQLIIVCPKLSSNYVPPVPEPDWANLSQQARLNATPENFGYFGLAFGLSGNSLAVGAPANTEAGSNAGRGYIFSRSGSTWSQDQVIVSTDHQAKDRLGESVSMSGDTAVFCAGLEQYNGGYFFKGAAYVFTKGGDWSGGSQLQMLKASDAQNDDDYGYSVAISNDGTYKAVGAPLEDTGGSNRGKVYIYVKSGATWSQQAMIQSNDIANGDKFGQSISLNEAGDTLVVGAWFKGGASNNGAPGAAYIFTRSGTNWTQQAKLLPADHTGNNDIWYFGKGVHISKDGNYVIVGSPQAKGVSSEAQGAAYIYYRSGTSWSQQARLLASDGAAHDEMSGGGSSGDNCVRLSGDANYAIVGAPYDDDNGTFAGTAFIFVRSGSTWSQQQKIQSAGITSQDRFGSSVAIDEDGDTVVVGAMKHDSLKGKSFVWVRSGTTWSQQAAIQHSDNSDTQNNGFGSSADIDDSGDIIIIGSNLLYSTSATAGVAYAFGRTGSSWTQLKKFVPDNPTSGDNFGQAIALSGDGKSVIFGAGEEDTTMNNSGAAYVFSIPLWSQQAKVQPSPIHNDERFGQRVVIHGDAMVVSARRNVNENVGAVYYFTRSGTTWTQRQKISPPDGTASGAVGGLFGCVGLDFNPNGYLIVGASNKTVGSAANTGQAYIYTLSGTTWSLQTTLNASDAGANKNFGSSVSINDDGDIAVVGCEEQNNGGNGSAYVFTRSGSTWTQAQKLTASDGAGSDAFGTSISIDEKSIAVGAHLDDDNGSASGSVYVFKYNGSTWDQVKKYTGAGASNRMGDRVLQIDATNKTLIVGSSQADGTGGGSGRGAVFVHTI